jgi:hypothetical protein
MQIGPLPHDIPGLLPPFVGVFVAEIAELADEDHVARSPHMKKIAQPPITAAEFTRVQR